MARFILVNRYFSPDESATAQFLTDLARHLAQSHEVVVITSRQMIERPDARLDAQNALGSVQIRRLWSTSNGRQGLVGRMLDYLTFLGSVFAWLLIHARGGDIVLAKTDPPLLGVVTTLATLGRGVRRMQWLQDLYPETAIALGVMSEDGPFTRFIRALRNWSLRESEVVIAVCGGMVDRLRSIAGPARIEHIPNWGEDFGEVADSPAQVNREFVVGYSGNLGRAHPIDALIQLAEQDGDSPVQFLITGGGANHQKLREHVSRLGRRNWAFLPYQPREKLAELLRAPHLHLVIQDPRVESFIFPSKVYGILSAGRPILHLGDPDSEMAHLLRAHGCGWSIAAHSGTVLHAKLDELRRSPAALEEAGRRARAAYVKHFSRARALARWDKSLGL